MDAETEKRIATAIIEAHKALDPIERTELVAILLRSPEKVARRWAGQRFQGETQRDIGLALLREARAAEQGLPC